MGVFQNLLPTPFDWGQYVGKVPWVSQRTIFVTRYGSHAYGTSTPESDLDLRGLVIPPREYFLGNLHRFEQTQNKAPVAKDPDDDAEEDPDFVIFGLNKFFKIAVECNPNALEIIFTDPSDHLVVTPLAEKLLAARQTFLTKRARLTFSGYAFSQLKRIKGHYQWLKNPPKAPPTRTEMGLPERTLIPKDQLAAANAAIQKKLDQWNFKALDEIPADTRTGLIEVMTELLAEVGMASDQRWIAASRTLGFSDNFIELLDLERRYIARLREWKQYQSWLRHRNPKRSALEARWGYDTKHAMHLVRLLTVCREILTLGEMRVRRPDAAFLLSIRDGYWTYEQLIEWAEKENAELTALLATCMLPEQPARQFIDDLLISLVDEGLQEAG